jgi:hypothetical protein
MAIMALAASERSVLGLACLLTASTVVRSVLTTGVAELV